MLGLENPAPSFPAALLTGIWKGDGGKKIDVVRSSATNERPRSRAIPA
jgi:hypothetical protein